MSVTNGTVSISEQYAHAQFYNLVSSGAKDTRVDVWERNASAQHVEYYE